MLCRYVAVSLSAGVGWAAAKPPYLGRCLVYLLCVSCREKGPVVAATRFPEKPGERASMDLPTLLRGTTCHLGGNCPSWRCPASHPCHGTRRPDTYHSMISSLQCSYYAGLARAAPLMKATATAWWAMCCPIPPRLCLPFPAPSRSRACGNASRSGHGHDEQMDEAAIPYRACNSDQVSHGL